MDNKEILMKIIRNNSAEKSVEIILKNYIPKSVHFDKQIKLMEDSIKVINELTKKINEVN